jgi:uncharacterized protein (DUF2336 family)
MILPPDSDISSLARLARDGGLDLAEVTFRVKTDLLMAAPNPSPADLDAYATLGRAVIPEMELAAALVLSEKLAPWPLTPPAIIDALSARAGSVAASLIAHGAPMDGADLDDLAASAPVDFARAIAARNDLSDRAILLLASRADRSIDFALAANEALRWPRPALELVSGRARDDATLATMLLSRKELRPVDLAQLYMHADRKGRAAIRFAVDARDTVAPRKPLHVARSEEFEELVALASAEPEAALAKLGAMASLGPQATSAMVADTSRELAALACLTISLGVEEATRFLILLGDDAARSVERIFTLVDLMRTTTPGTALRLIALATGDSSASQPRDIGQHVPVMDASGTGARAAPGRTQRLPASKVLDKLGSKTG